jgi:REP element-mobilizing transposase RayT
MHAVPLAFPSRSLENNPMSSPSPIYTIDNCHSAYQLNWSLSIFWRESVQGQDAVWLTALQAATEPDGVRILEHRFIQPDVSQFLISTRPEISPQQMVRSVKGRLQYFFRQKLSKAFQRNYGLRSIGSAKREEVERYVRGQIDHHPMVDARVQEMLRTLQISNPHVDLSAPRQNAHALYWYNLHVCFVNEERCREFCKETLEKMRTMILRAAEKKGHLLSRAGIVPDHIHLTLSCNVAESPGEVAISYMNNLAYACGSKWVFSFGYYVGTIGEYNLSAVRL